MVETVNNAVVLPEVCDWSQPPKLTETWPVKIANGVGGNEDRATGRTSALRRLDWQVLVADTSAQERFSARVRAALKSGRAVAPFWGRGQNVPDLGLVTIPQLTVYGAWPWQAGDWAFFVRGELGLRNVTRKINCGGYAAGGWDADPITTDLGRAVTSDTIDTSQVGGWPPAPQLILQSERFYMGFTPGGLTYTIQNLQPGIPCRLRLHFCEIQPGRNRTWFQRIFDVAVIGDQVQQVDWFEPYVAAGYVANKASVIDFLICPDMARRLTIALTARVRQVDACAASNIDLSSPITQIDDVGISPGALFLCVGQTDARQNGPYIYRPPSSGGPYRPDWAAVGLQLKGMFIQVQGGTLHGGWVYRNSNDTVPGVGGDAITWERNTGEQYHCGINAIELYQYGWELVQVSSFTPNGPPQTQGLMVLAQALHGDFGGQQVYPAFWGKPTAQSWDLHTGDKVQAMLSLQEPLGTGALGLPGGCSEEICDGVFPPDLPLESEQPPGEPVWYSTYVWPYAPGMAPTDVMATITPAWRVAWTAVVVAQFRTAYPDAQIRHLFFFAGSASGAFKEMGTTIPGALVALLKSAPWHPLDTDTDLSLTGDTPYLGIGILYTP